MKKVIYVHAWKPSTLSKAEININTYDLSEDAFYYYGYKLLETVEIEICDYSQKELEALFEQTQEQKAAEIAKLRAQIAELEAGDE